MSDSDKFARLHEVLELAAKEVIEGKGAQRHGDGKPFEEQPGMVIGRLLTGVGSGPAFQAVKKIIEGVRLQNKREILGAVNYCVMVYLQIDEATRDR